MTIELIHSFRRIATRIIKVYVAAIAKHLLKTANANRRFDGGIRKKNAASVSGLSIKRAIVLLDDSGGLVLPSDCFFIRVAAFPLLK
jgi:hypothetical protein